MSDEINHPQHYNQLPNGIECIDVIEHFPCNAANAIKYIWRADYKDDAITDLKKAIWYLEREIERIKESKSAPSPSMISYYWHTGSEENMFEIGSKDDNQKCDTQQINEIDDLVQDCMDNGCELKVVVYKDKCREKLVNDFHLPEALSAQ